MKITLNIDGKDKTFTNDFVRARMFREALRLNESFSAGEQTLTQQFDDLAEFVVKVYNNQFTVDDLWDGLLVESVQNEIQNVFNKVLNAGGFMTTAQATAEKSV